MNVLMLGWEYPPNIAGGLGVACEGLTKAVSQRGVGITFVVPKLLGGEDAGHMQLSDSFAPIPASSAGSKFSVEQVPEKVEAGVELYPYTQPGASDSVVTWLSKLNELQSLELIQVINEEASEISSKSHYGRNVFEEVARYTARVVKRFSSGNFDLIHAHDWMTYPAGVALSKLTGKPLVVHVHSSDYDRSGSGRNNEIYQIERMGVHAANAVIAVSEYTKGVVHSHYEVPLEKISVVHNGIYPKMVQQIYQGKKAKQSVLFLGRVTLQKGPDYYIEAAAKVLEILPDVEFVLAGTGDMLPGLVDRVHNLGIQDNFNFAGFLSGIEVERAFLEADLYVMPSVSEPFGISALEAISFDTPVLMSKQSGAGEVLRHSLKFDFWDTDRLADLIINGLLHQELREDMMQMARQELVNVRWELSAARTEEVYNAVA